MRIGFGYDVHRFAEGRPLVVGGIVLESDRGLDGHSDADVLLHAIADAVLGALALGDIGSHFPDTDPKWEGADSVELLREVVRLAREQGWGVTNVDSTLVMEAPKIRPYVDAMRARTADALGVEVSRVSIKATTSERMGFVGTGEGAAAYAVVLLHSVA